MNDLSAALKIIESYGLIVVRARRRKSPSNDIEEKVNKEMADPDGRWRRRSAFRMTDAQIDRIKKLWDEDVDTAKIAEKVGCSISTVYAYVR